LHRTRLSITINADMKNIYGTKRQWGDKIALLGLFIAALLTARLIVAFKSALALSEPITLPHTGLSVSIPIGNGWQSEKQWRYRENTFILSSIFTAGSGRPTAWANCQYLLTTETRTPKTWFEQKASEVEGTIIKTDQKQMDTLTIDYTHIQKPEVFLDMFLGVTKLPNNRQLNIEVYQITGDSNLAERAFKSIINSLNFEDNHLLEAGSEIITKIKSKGLNGFLDNQNQQTFFMIKDSRGKNIGFTMDVLIDSGADAKLNITAAGIFYIRELQTFEQVTSFQCSNNLAEFIYKMETYDRTSRSGTEIILDEAGVTTVRKFDAQPEEKSYRLSPAAIPEVFIDQLFIQMLDSNQKEIVVDIIEAAGKITPTLISRIDLEKDAAADKDVAYVFEQELLDRRGFSEQVYLDNQKQVYRRVAQQENIYILERTSAENIIREFPEHAEHILRNKQMLK